MKKILSLKWSPALVAVIIVTVLITVGFVRAVTNATTIGSNINTAGTLTVTGGVFASSTVLVDGNVTLGSALTNTIALTGRITSVLNASSTALFGDNATFYNGVAINGNTTIGSSTINTLALNARITTMLNASSTALFGGTATFYGIANIANASSTLASFGSNGTTVAGLLHGTCAITPGAVPAFGVVDVSCSPTVGLTGLTAYKIFVTPMHLEPYLVLSSASSTADGTNIQIQISNASSSAAVTGAANTWYWMAIK